MNEGIFEIKPQAPSGETLPVVHAMEGELIRKDELSASELRFFLRDLPEEAQDWVMQKFFPDGESGDFDAVLASALFGSLEKMLKKKPEDFLGIYKKHKENFGSDTFH